MRVEEYNSSYKDIWNRFLTKSKNGMFLFDRDYMEYHKDRFIDGSLMFYDDDRLMALMPMSIDGICACSHGGLTFGGFIVGRDMKQHHMNDCFTALRAYMSGKGIKHMTYKSIPHMYHRLPAEEDLYSLYCMGAKIKKIEPTTVVRLNEPIKMSKGRKAQISRAKREGVEVFVTEARDDYFQFIKLENSVLEERHGIKAVHSGEELFMLRSKFPDNIRLYIARMDGRMISGVLLFVHEDVIHTQYMCADEEARKLGALDLTISTIIEQYKGKKNWLDFGISSEDEGRCLNLGLISQKEGFGGRTNVYATWEILAN